jgi:hypothetical protein
LSPSDESKERKKEKKKRKRKWGNVTLKADTVSSFKASKQTLGSFSKDIKPLPVKLM